VQNQISQLPINFSNVNINTPTDFGAEIIQW